MNFDWREIIGIIATIFVWISFTQSDDRRIRIINSIGSVLFVGYGLLIGSWSVWILNASLFLLQIHQLRKDTSKFKK